LASKKKRQNLKAGTLEYDFKGKDSGKLFGGGYHALYTNVKHWISPLDFEPLKSQHPRNAATLQHYGRVPAPGPELFLAPFGDGSLLYGYDNADRMVIINQNPNPAAMSVLVKSIKGYGEGPLSVAAVTDGKNPGMEQRIMFEPLRSGQGWAPVKVNNMEQYVSAYGGRARLGKGGRWVSDGDPQAASPAWGGWDDKTGGSKSNLSGNPFHSPVRTKDDKAGAVLDNFILPFGMQGIFAGLAAGFNALTGGLATPLVDMAAGELADLVSDGIAKATGMGKSPPGMTDWFSQAMDTPTATSNEPDPNFNKTIQTDIVRKQYHKTKAEFKSTVEKLWEPDPTLSDEQNIARRKALKAVMAVVTQKNQAESLYPSKLLDDPTRDRRLDKQEYSDNKDAIERMKYMMHSIPAAQQATMIKNKVDGLSFTNMQLNNRIDDYRSVMQNIVPDKYMDSTERNTQLKMVTDTGNKLHTNFYNNIVAEKRKFSNSMDAEYSDLVDDVFDVKGRDITTQADKQKFEELKTQGVATDADWALFVRQKAETFFKKTGRDYDVKGALGKGEHLSEYKKRYKAALGKTFYTDLSDEETARLEEMYKTPTLRKWEHNVDDWKITTHDFAHTPDEIKIPQGFTEEQTLIAKDYIKSIRDLHERQAQTGVIKGDKAAVVSF